MTNREEKHLTPVWIVYVDGKRLDTEHEGALQKIHMDDVLDGVGACTLEFDTSAVRIAESGTFSFESVVSVHLGYKDDCEEVFAGEVTDFETRYNEYGNERFLVICSSFLHRLKNSYKPASFESKRLSDILKGIVDSYSLKSDIEDFGARKEYQVKLGATDLDYLLESAKKYGKTAYCYGSTVYVKDEVTVRDDDIILEWGKTLIKFSGREQLKGLLSGCSFTGWNENVCEAISGSASLKDLPVKIGGSKSWEDNSNGAGGKWQSVFWGDTVYDNDDAKALAIGKLVESSFRYQTGVAKCEGDYRIHPGMRVNIKYVGRKFSGEYIADRVEHDLSVGEAFVTTVHLKRNFCETSIHKEVSAVDNEMAQNRSKNSQDNATASQTDGSETQEEDSAEEEKNPQITNPRWEKDGQSITKALVGDEITLCADVTDIADGADATIKIVEKDDDGNDDDVTTLSAKVQNGKIECKWKVIYTEDDDDSNSQQEKEEKGYTLPEYAFTVECDGVESDESGQLDVRGWIKFSFTEKQAEIFKNCTFYLYSNNWKSECVKIENNKISFNGIPVFSERNNCKLGVNL